MSTDDKNNKYLVVLKIPTMEIEILMRQNSENSDKSDFYVNISSSHSGL